MKKGKLPSVVTVLILTLITAVMWVSLNVYRSLTEKPPPAIPPEISEPLDPSLDIQTLNQIQSRLFLEESEIPIVAATPETSPTPSTLTPNPSPTPLTTPLPATESANISQQ